MNLAERPQGQDVEESVPPSSPQAELEAAPESFVFPTSFQQRGMWLVEQLEAPGVSYNIPVAYRWKGELNLGALEKALDEIVRRHETLRTTFAMQDGEPCQVVTEHGRLPLEIVDLRAVPEAQREESARLFLAEHATRKLDLLHGPLCLVALVRLSEREHLFLLNVHHIVSDRWSLEVFYGELTILYNAFAAGQASPLPDPAFQYADYAIWQAERMSNQAALAPQVAFWKQQVAGMPQFLELPTDFPRPAQRSVRGAWTHRRLPKELTAQIGTFSREEGGTPYMTLMAAMQVLLYRQSGQEDFLIGSAIAGRKQEGLDALLGDFINTLVIPCRLGGNPSFRELLRQVRATSVAGYANQDVPFELLLREIAVERQRSHAPVFQVMLIVQNQPPQERTLTGLAVEQVWTDSQTSKFDITLMVEEIGGALEFQCEYCTDLFRKETIDTLLERLETILASALRAPDENIAILPWLSEREKAIVQRFWGEDEHPFPADLNIPDMIHAQALRTPDVVAVEDGDRKLSYREFLERADELARRLVRLGVGPNTLVGLCVNRSIEMAVGLLGILRSGGAYLPLDPAYPADRLAYMLEHSRAKVLLTEEKLAASLAQPQLSVICLDGPKTEVDEPAVELARATPDDLAYVIYTSGSTGKPKGVAVQQRPLVNLLTWHHRILPTGPGVRTLQFTSLSFDVSFQEIFSTWIAGGTLVMISQEQRSDLAAMIQFSRERSIERLFLSFAALHGMAEAAEQVAELPSTLRQISTVGEQLQVSKPLVRLFERLGNCTLHNQYGPTEAAVIVTSYAMPGAPSTWPALPPIGRPEANIQLYILDRHDNPVPPGVVGELYIGGVCLAQGYLHQPELTNERFTEKSLFGLPPRRMYRTGDLARYLPDGNLECLGRTDHQIKLRGYRIELGEVETTLGTHPDIAQCVVSVRESASAGKRLVAYLVAKPGSTIPGAEEIRAFLSTRLPDYMVPAVYMVLEAMPMTPSGKVDRTKLPDPAEAATSGTGGAHREPTDLIEMQLVTLWEKLLDRYPIGTDQDFFSIGGHSLLAIQLVTQIQKAFQVRLPVVALFELRTISDIAARIRELSSGSEAAGTGTWAAAVPLRVAGSQAPLFCLPGAGSNLLAYRWLIQYLDAGVSVYGLQPPSIQGTAKPFTSIEEAASFYVARMREIQPRGPYHIKGWCMGGLVAYEIARQLSEAGEEVPLVLMVDTVFPRDISWQERLAFNWKEMTREGAAELPRLAWEKARGFVAVRQRNLRHSRQAQRFESDRNLSAQDIEDGLVYSDFQAALRYRPGRFPGRVTLLWPRLQPVQPYVDSRLEWSRIAAQGAEHLEIDGDHSSIYLEPLVPNLARVISDLYAKAQSGVLSL